MKSKYLIGTSGWNYKHWKGKFYPGDIPVKSWFGHYSSVFNTVEVNYTFYRWPDEDTIKNWYKNSPANFTYTLKAPRLITHFKKLKDVKEPVRRFYGLGGLLKEKMGCYLFQLPPNYDYNKNNFDKLKRFVEILDGRKSNVIEFRDGKWWSKEVYDLLNENKTIFCNVSGLDMPEKIITTSRYAYFRFHGDNYSTKYSPKEMRGYAEAITYLDIKRVYAYFNNDNNAYAVENALELKEAIQDA